MAASEKTQYYQLPVYQPDDITSWLTDFNGAMEKIDAALHAIAQGGGGGGETINVVQTTGQSQTDVMSQKAVTDQLATKADTSAIPTVPNVVQTTGQSQTNVMSQKAVTDALAGAGGEWDNARTTLTTLTGGAGTGTIYITPSTDNSKLLITGKNLSNTTNQIATQINLPTNITITDAILNQPFNATAMFNNPVAGVKSAACNGYFSTVNTLNIRSETISGATSYSFAINGILYI